MARIPSLAELTPAGLAELAAADDATRVAHLPAWDLDEAGRHAASLANAAGGLIVVADAAGLADADLLQVGDALDPDGDRLVRARLLETPRGPMGVIAVRESADPPVLCGDAGAILERTADGPRAVTTRAALDGLIDKRARLRARAESVIDAQTERTAFGHLNFLTLALILAPVGGASDLFGWAQQHQPELLRTRLALASGFARDDVTETAGLLAVRHPRDESSFLTVAKNGTITVGLHRKRPARDRFVSAPELAGVLRDFAEAARILTAGGDAGLVQPALFVQGIRGLRLETAGGWGAPCLKDQQRVFLPRQYLTRPADEARLGDALVGVLGDLFAADLAAGLVESYRDAAERTPAPRPWHGRTRRTERRLAFARPHGS